jgi:hypothetical protein
MLWNVDELIAHVSQYFTLKWRYFLREHLGVAAVKR